MCSWAILCIDNVKLKIKPEEHGECPKMDSTRRVRGSGTFCAVRGCVNSWRRLNTWLERECFDHRPTIKRHCGCTPPYTFHQKPKAEDESRMWLAALKLKNPPKRLYVCSYHFVDRKPTKEHPFPELWLGCDRPPETKKGKRKRNFQSNEIAESDEPKFRDATTQWEDFTWRDHTYASVVPCVHKATQTEIQPTAYGVIVDDSSSLLYTGLKLLNFYTLVSTMLQFGKKSCSIPIVDQILMTLMKLRQNLALGDLAHRFRVCTSTVSNIITYWIDTLGEQLEPMVCWLPRCVIRGNMPPAFKKKYPHTTCIIKCAKTSIQRATNLNIPSATFSHHKSTNNIKYLVAVSPHGLIMFISAGYAGKSSEKCITMNSGLLKALRPGDEVLADRSFTIHEMLHERKVKLNIPAFSHKRGQLNKVTRTRRVPNVLKHVEWAIQRLKVFKILSQTVPISIAPRFDKILTICAACVNMRCKLRHQPQKRLKFGKIKNNITVA
ncbi:uncharacterized protein si:dkey-56d12.4 [Corythoichthys intestinalis]|uniref:uncharacterized protein si:dkey-56d12.4 n=1 Tax=Corythoichthys intestinalis TaxID=161448 RepID=UPI0025A673F3|nr:uncharacterized protein si:dkey-56d12.4 [Corythoichthys intestinalis]